MVLDKHSGRDFSFKKGNYPELRGGLGFKIPAEAGDPVIAIASGQEVSYKHYTNNSGRKLKIRILAGK